MRAPSADRDFSFAVFLANHNHAHFLRSALDALLAQSFPPDAIYVIDDCSSDDSRSIVHEYAARHAVIVPIFNEEQKGYIASATDWMAANPYDFVYFAAADDFVLPGFFEKTIALLRQVPEAGLCSSLCHVLDEGQDTPKLAASPLPRRTPGYVSPAEASDSLYRWGSWFWGTSTIYRRESFLRHGGLDATLHGYCDGFLAMVIALHEGACFVPESLAVWRRFLTSSISAETLKDVALSSSILAEVSQRLRCDYADVTPPGFSRRFVRRWIYSFIERQLANPKDMDVILLRDAIAEYTPRLAKILPWIISFPPWLRRGILAVMLRPFDIFPAIGRRLLKSNLP